MAQRRTDISSAKNEPDDRDKAMRADKGQDIKGSRATPAPDRNSPSALYADEQKMSHGDKAGSTTGLLGGIKSDGKASPQSFRKGGMVRKSGMAKVHRGERVLTKSQASKYKKGKSR